MDDNVCEVVFVQAHTADEAVAKARTFCDNSDSCPCCGDRWSFWVDDSDGCPVPSMYGEPLECISADYFRKEARLHYIDGHIETLKFGEARAATLKAA